uniref:Putative metalloprotease n=1 Tax=Ixodes ricinus TaxID=34613 RepID=A0A0K8RFQ9_IXORI
MCSIRLRRCRKQKTYLVHYSIGPHFSATKLPGTHLEWYMMETKQYIALLDTSIMYAAHVTATQWHQLQTALGMDNGLRVPRNTCVGFLRL